MSTSETANHSAVLNSRVESGKLAEWQRVFCAAFRSPGGKLTLAVVNDAPQEFPMEFSIEGLPKAIRLNRYRYGEAEHDRADGKVTPTKESSLGPPPPLPCKTRCRQTV